VVINNNKKEQMEQTDIERHISDYENESNGILEELKEGEEDVVKVPNCPKALVHDIVQFDLASLDFRQKLGQGKCHFFFS
jgi:hypothetical protein